MYFEVEMVKQKLFIITNFAGNKVPPSLLEKAGKLRDEGGAAMINKLMSDLPELLNRNREILDVVSIWMYCLL